MKKHKICIVCSSGGHLLQLMQLSEWWEQYDRFWVTFKKPDAEYLLREEQVYWGYFPTTRNWWNLLRNSFMALYVIVRERPQIVVSTGAGIAIPYFYISKLFGVKTIFIEAFNRINSQTLTGKVVEPIADRFYVQWEEQQKLYKKAKLLGRLL